MFAKRTKQLHLRNKSTASQEVKIVESNKDESLISSIKDIQKDEGKNTTPLSPTDATSEINKNDTQPPLKSFSDSSDDSDHYKIRLNSAKRSISSTNFGIRSKKLLKATREVSKLDDQKELLSFPGQRSLELDNDLRATAQFSIDTELGQDNRSILERNEKIGKQILDGELAEGIYRGIGAYKPIVKRRDGAIAAGKYTGAYGPVRGSENIRMTMRIDLNPEICKDYKETGYCGFGDTCKFLHDRSDYKAGWQLEKEWEAQQKKNQERLKRKAEGESVSSDSASSSDEEDSKIPFACLICKNKWQDDMNPVVTLCGHYFCESCAFKHYAKSSKCAYCKQQTSGIFNNAESAINYAHLKIKEERLQE